MVLSADFLRLRAYSSNEGDAGYFDLTAADGSTTVSIDDLDDDYQIVSAALSPDGAHVAAYEIYRGDDPAVRDGAAGGRVSITSTASLFAGTPSWSTITDIGPGVPSSNVGRPFTTLVWPTADRLYVELSDSIWAIDVAPG